MTDRKARDTSPSPPTDRVVSIVEMLAHCAPATSADALGLSRSTVGSILTALRERGWVRRLPDLSYSLAPALAGITEKTRGRPRQGHTATHAFADPATKQRWLDTAPVNRRAQLENGPAEIVDAGVGVWGADGHEVAYRGSSPTPAATSTTGPHYRAVGIYPSAIYPHRSSTARDTPYGSFG